MLTKFFSPMDFLDELLSEEERLLVLKLSLEEQYVLSYGVCNNDTIKIVFNKKNGVDIEQVLTKTFRKDDVANLNLT